MSKALMAIVVPVTLAFAGIFGPLFSAHAGEDRTKNISVDSSTRFSRHRAHSTEWSHPPDDMLPRRWDGFPRACNEYTRLYQRGTGSWYGPGFHGKKMANGETYDMNAYTVAHRKLRKGTPICILNPKNGAVVHAVVTDRGPYKGNRIIDLSRRIAEDLGMRHDGLAEVYIFVRTKNS